jgi:hypothetical protein
MCIAASGHFMTSRLRRGHALRLVCYAFNYTYTDLGCSRSISQGRQYLRSLFSMTRETGRSMSKSWWMSFSRGGSSVALVPYTAPQPHQLRSSSATRIFYGDPSSHAPALDRERFVRHSKPCSRSAAAAAPFFFLCKSTVLIPFRPSLVHRTRTCSTASQQNRHMILRKRCCAHE